LGIVKKEQPSNVEKGNKFVRMKYLTPTLLFAILLFLGANFYFDRQTNQKINDLEAKVATAKEGPSPFDKIAEDPLYDVKESQKGPVTSIAFEQKEFDFGRIKEGILSHTAFKFTNTGKENLLISHATGSCGCTVPEWPTEFIKPGQTGEIKVQFDSKDKLGEQLKTVTVTANTNPAATVLTIKAVVLPRE